MENSHGRNPRRHHRNAQSLAKDSVEAVVEVAVAVVATATATEAANGVVAILTEVAEVANGVVAILTEVAEAAAVPTALAVMLEAVAAAAMTVPATRLMQHPHQCPHVATMWPP